MNKIYRTLKLDMYEPTYETVRYQQNDTNRSIIFQLYNQGELYKLDSNEVFATIDGQYPNGETFKKLETTIFNNEITWDIPIDVTAYTGIITAVVSVYDLGDGTLLSSIPFKLLGIEDPAKRAEQSVEQKSASTIDDLTVYIKNVEADLHTHENDMIAHLTQEEHAVLDNTIKTYEGENEIAKNGDYFYENY